MAEKGVRAALTGGAEVRMELRLAEEQRVERDGFSQCHTDNGLDKNRSRGTGIAADGFSGFEADKAYANCSAQAAEAALKASCEFSDNVYHDGWFFVGWMTAVRTLGTVPAEK
jgi:hypothetical protein